MAVFLQAARYSAASARVHALLPQLIQPGQWAVLLDAPDLTSLFAFLRSLNGLPALVLFGEAKPDVVRAERDLTSHYAVAARRPLNLLHNRQLELLDWFWRRFELDNVKTLLRAVHHGSPPSQAHGALIALDELSSLPWDELAVSPSIPALVDRLAGFSYERTLRDALPQYRRQQSVFPLEVALDLAYHSTLLDLVNQLRGAEHADADAFLRAWVDAQNILWAFRYRFYAQLSPEEILNYTLHHGLRADADVVRAIAMGAPLAGVVQSVWGAGLTDLKELARLDERELAPRLELVFQRHFYRLAKRALMISPLRLATVLAYEFLLDSEMRDLTAVIEGKSVGWPAAQIQPYLIAERGL